MLSKKYRLPIQQWFKDKKKFTIRKSDFFIIRICLNDFSYSRFGIIISSKVSKSSVQRNKIKRTIFDFIRLNKLNEVSGQDFLITVLPSVGKLKKKDLEEKIKFLISLR